MLVSLNMRRQSGQNAIFCLNSPIEKRIEARVKKKVMYRDAVHWNKLHVKCWLVIVCLVIRTYQKAKECQSALNDTTPTSFQGRKG